ncbi:MAG: nucleotidyl transferase AbiEii/AbiGii toxin family protein [Bacteroidota bacterium]
MLHSQTVTDDLLNVARKLCEILELKEFRIVGGTAVALHFGHRISVDIDFFSGEKVNKKHVSTLLMEAFPGSEVYVMQYGIRSEIQGIKVELFDDWSTKFHDTPVIDGGLRLASPMDLAALKLDTIIERREKKDYIDLYVLFKALGSDTILEKFKTYNPHVSEKSVLFALGEVNAARDNKSIMPEMLIDISWEQIEASMIKAAEDYLITRKPQLKVRRRGRSI